MKTMYIYENMDQTGETAFFFDDKKLITSIDGNDGHYRDEYMNCLFENFGVKVKRVDNLNKFQKKEYLKYLNENDIELFEESKEASDKNFDYYSVRIPSPFGYQDVLFFFSKELKNADSFIKLYSKFMELGKTKYKDTQLEDLRVSYFFKKEAKEITRVSDNQNYLAKGNIASDFCLVLKIRDPKEVNSKWKGYSSIKTDKDFWEYIELDSRHDKIEGEQIFVFDIEKFK